MAADEIENKVDETAAEPAETPAAEADKAKPAKKPARPRAAKPKPKAEKTAEAAAKTEAPAEPDAGAPAEAAPGKAPAKTKAAATAAPAKPKRAAKPRAAKPKAEKPAEAESSVEAPPEAAAAEAAVEPAEAEAVVEGEAEPAAKPRRTRARKAAPVEPPAPKERPAKQVAEPQPVHEPRRGTAGVATVIDADGKEQGTRELPAARFGVAANVNSLHLVVRAEQAARRRGTASSKSRGQVSGSTAKLYRQKGTGRARAGSVKSPVRTGGGVAFGPHPRSFDIKVNRKVVKKALAMALSNRAENGNLFVAAGLELDAPSTRRLNDLLVALDCAAPVLVVTHDEPAVSKSVRNLFYAETAEVGALSTEQVLRTRSMVLTEKAFDALSQA